MELKDLFLTPIYIILIYWFAYLFRNKVTNSDTKRYFIPGLSVKLLGSIMVGVIYTFYYSGGDTTHYFTYSKALAEVIVDDPSVFFNIAFTNNISDPNLIVKLSSIKWVESPAEFAVIKFASFFNLFSFSTYTVTSMFFACFCFSGSWALYVTLLKIYPRMVKPFAYAVFFVPSLFFWGSGLLKDTLCLGAMGWLFFAFYGMLIEKKNIIRSAILFVISFLILNTIKKYILLAFLPAMAFWLFMEHNNKIKSKLVKFLAMPFFATLGVLFAYLIATSVTEGDQSYDVTKIASRTKINADFLYQVSLLENGSAYNIGELDGTLQGMFKLAPNAINVSLFRPYLWEVRNPLMLLSAFESAFYLCLTIYILFKHGIFKTFSKIFSIPLLTFSFIFSLVFAFAVGINSFNFGTLVRYKIPLIPFFSLILFYLYFQINRVKAKRA